MNVNLLYQFFWCYCLNWEVPTDIVDYVDPLLKGFLYSVATVVFFFMLPCSVGFSQKWIFIVDDSSVEKYAFHRISSFDRMKNFKTCGNLTNHIYTRSWRKERKRMNDEKSGIQSHSVQEEDILKRRCDPVVCRCGIISSGTGTIC